jgi:hypothetical protein
MWLCRGRLSPLLYVAQRLKLFREIDQTTLSVQTILNGDSNISVDENILILDPIHKYVVETGRFRV